MGLVDPIRICAIRRIRCQDQVLRRLELVRGESRVDTADARELVFSLELGSTATIRKPDEPCGIEFEMSTLSPSNRRKASRWSSTAGIVAPMFGSETVCINDWSRTVRNPDRYRACRPFSPRRFG